MAHLRVHDQGVLTNHVNGNFPVCYFVNQGEYGRSQGLPLFTWGALPCMNVVVHNRAASRGCLAHVSHNSLNQTTLFTNAYAAVQTMLAAAGNPAAADIYLFAGQAWITGSTYVTSGRQGQDFDRYLAARLPQHYVWNGLHAAMGQILYWPANDAVYFVSDQERTSLQGTMVTYSNLGLLARAILTVTVAAL